MPATTSAAPRERASVRTSRPSATSRRRSAPPTNPLATGEEGGALHVRLSLSSADQQAAEPREVLDGGAHRDRAAASMAY